VYISSIERITSLQGQAAATVEGGTTKRIDTEKSPNVRPPEDIATLQATDIPPLAKLAQNKRVSTVRFLVVLFHLKSSHLAGASLSDTLMIVDIVFSSIDRLKGR
jgi:hypothetical protein